MNCTGRLFMPNPIQGIWLEARCNRFAIEGERVCDVCKFANLLGVIDGDVPHWTSMLGNSKLTIDHVTPANMKIIQTSTNIAHMFPDNVGRKIAEIPVKNEHDILPILEQFAEVNESKMYSIEDEFDKLQTAFESFKENCDAEIKMSSKPRKQGQRQTQVQKKGTIPLEPHDAAVMKSHAGCVLIHYAETDMEPIEIAEIIYKKVKKEVVIDGGQEYICYYDEGTYYQCGLQGEIKGIIKNGN
jgi:hypothetical protein